MGTKKNRLVIFLSLISVGVVIGLVLLWMDDPLYLKAPSDDSLIQSFQSHQTEYERLREMAAEDSSKESYFTASHLDSRLDSARRDEYVNMLSNIQSGLILTYSPNMTRFIFAGGGLSAIGPSWLKGIEYLPGHASGMGVEMQSLDKIYVLQPGVMYLRKIQPNWFVVVEKYD